jgi:CRP/FNR family transcriptional regulator, cyclic AMP receptor protein
MSSVSQRSKLKSGSRPVQLNNRSFKKDEILFEEGTVGKEAYVIQEGKVAVYKDTPEGRIELATIEQSGIVGEMSLLDSLPRSATVIASADTRALVISDNVFHAVLRKSPAWLTSIVKIVVSRLRDANRRVDQSALRDRERGMAALLLLLLPVHKQEFGSKIVLPFDLVIIEAYYVCRLRKKESKRILERLEKRSLVKIVEDADQKKRVCIGDHEALRLFLEYRKLAAENQTFRELAISEEAAAMLGNIAYVAQKSGKQTQEGTTLMRSALVEDLADRKSGHIEKNLFDLRRKGLINIMPAGNKDEEITFRQATISRIKKIKQWAPRFSMEFA